MLPIQYAYPEDRNGTNPENRIVNERHTITPANGTNFNFLIPRAAPYFESSMVVRHEASGTVLTKGIDWVPSYKFEMASNTPPFLQVFGAVSVLTNSYNGGTLVLEYQTLGGAYTLEESDLTTVLANTTIDPRIASWESVTMKPGVYLPEAHLHNIVDTVGYAELVASVVAFKDAYIAETGRVLQILNTHVQDLNNPHETDLAKLGIERFQDVVLATIDEINSAAPSQLNYVSAAVLKYYLDTIAQGSANTNAELQALRARVDQHDTDLAQLSMALSTAQGTLTDHGQRIAVLEAQISQLTSVSGDQGDLPFFTGEAGFFKVVNGQALSTVGIVNNDAELTAQFNYRESFAEVFNSWRRVAFLSGNPVATPSELNGWSYDPATDRIRSTINSNSHIALVSPIQVRGDYVFEVELQSTNNDDDTIGLCLGLVRLPNGNHSMLTVYRSASHPSQSTNSPGATMRLVLNGSSTLVSDGPYESFPNGWNGYFERGPVLLKVTRTGTVLTIETGDAGQSYSRSMTFDLASNASTQVFAGGVNLGYASQSQTAASWRTLRRTGANAPVAAIHTGQVFHWDGSQYVLAAASIADTIIRGRFYVNPLTKRLYYALASGSPLVIGNDSIGKDHTKVTGTRDRVVYSTIDNRAQVGDYVDHWSQNVSTGAMTYNGCVAKYEPDSYDIRSASEGDVSTLWLGAGNLRYAGVMALPDNSIGFRQFNGNRPIYMDANGVLQHAGINKTSDRTVKFVGEEFDYDAIDLTDLKLFHFKWAKDVRISETLWGKEDLGPMAQDVQKLFPHCVKTNPTTGLLTIDDASLATTLSIVLLKRLEKLIPKE